jgi:2-(1,2-epoxy-1,2-dihydrophenyl)acetyl-CoA isomerase
MTSIAAVVRMERDGPVTTITLNRPESLNALDRATIERLDAALRTVVAERSARVVILTGAGRAFSAGQDLRELEQIEAARGAAGVGDQLREGFNPVILRLRRMEQPVIAAVNGVAAGAGFALALACDLRVAAEGASFVASPVGLGLIPAAGSAALLAASLGLSRASALALLGERIGAATAAEMGLVDAVVPAADLLPAARALADRLVALPAPALALTKRALTEAITPNLRAVLDAEAELQTFAAHSDEHQRRLREMLARMDRPASADQG